MSYGSPEWQGWVLEEEESIKHIKAAYVLPGFLFTGTLTLVALRSYDAGINTFDTANVLLDV